MSLKSTSKKSPRAMPVETIITRYKSAQQKLKTDKEPTNVISGKLKNKSERKHAKLQTKQAKEIETKRYKKKEEESAREFYPEKSKRNTLNKKVVLPKHCLKLIGGTNGCNKRKMHVPRKEVTKRARHNSSSSAPSEIDNDSPKHKPKEMSIKDMVLFIEEHGGLDEEDLLEILTCPSPVWWEDPPAGFAEDPILTRPRSVERKSVKNQLMEERIKEAERKKKTEGKTKSESTNGSDVSNRNLDITTLDVNIRNRDVNFMNKRCKLESLLGSIKNKVKNYCDNTEQNITKSSNTTSHLKLHKDSGKTDNTKVRIDTVKEFKGDVEVNKKKRNSDSFEEGIISLDDEGILSLENINIPIAPNRMLANKIDTKVKTTNAACRKKGSKQTKTESEHRKRFCNSKSLLHPECNNKNRRSKKESPIKIKIPVSTNRIKVKSKDKHKNIKMNALSVKMEDTSNDTEGKIKDDNDTKKSVNEIDKIFVKVDDHISKYTVNDTEKNTIKIVYKSSKDCEKGKSFIKIIDTSVRDGLKESKKISSEENVKRNEQVPVKSENSISDKNIVENKGVMDIKEDISNHDISEINEKIIKTKGNITERVSARDKSIEIIDVISDDESEVGTAFAKIKKSNEMKDFVKQNKNVERRVSIDSDVSDRNMSEEYLDMSVFDDEDQKIEQTHNQNSLHTEICQSDMGKLPKGYSRSSKRSSRNDKPANINTEPNTDGQNIFDAIKKPKLDEINNIYNVKEYVADEKKFEYTTPDQNVDIEIPITELKSPEYIEVYKIINSDSDNETNLSKNNEILDKNNDDDINGVLKQDKLDKPLDYYYKQCKIIKSNNKIKDPKIKEVKVERNCDYNLKSKSVLVSDDDGVKYCLICSSIFDTESCKYCMGKSKNRCSCENGSQYECNTCNVIMNTKEAIRHIKDHKSE